jgi:hypothetical protein
MTQDKEMELGFMSLDLARIKKDAERIAGEWNGDESGQQEEKAQCATEVIETINTLENLLQELYA